MTRVITHELYNGSYLNDVAILKLVNPIMPGLNAGVIAVANSTPVEGSTVDATGWARGSTEESTSRSRLQIVAAQKILSKSERAKHYDHSNGNDVVPDAVTCGEDQTSSACKADIGSPVTQNGRFVGVVIWRPSNCSAPNGPSLYANVEHFNEWITQLVNTANTAKIAVLVYVIVIVNSLVLLRFN